MGAKITRCFRRRMTAASMMLAAACFSIANAEGGFARDVTPEIEDTFSADEIDGTRTAHRRSGSSWEHRIASLNLVAG